MLLLAVRAPFRSLGRFAAPADRGVIVVITRSGPHAIWACCRPVECLVSITCCTLRFQSREDRT